MSKVTSKEANIIKKGFNYENDKYILFKKSEKRAWIISGISVFLLFLSLVGYFVLLPLKEVKPYLIGFDKSTGIVDPITAVNSETLSANEMLDRYFINQYIQMRESYIYETIQNSYELTQLFSTSNVAKEFREEYNRPDSLDNILGSTGKAIVKVNSITLEKINNTNLATARINVAYTDSKNHHSQKNYTVRLSYLYEPETKLQLSQRIENPIGFFVMSYQKIEENI